MMDISWRGGGNLSQLDWIKERRYESNNVDVENNSEGIYGIDFRYGNDEYDVSNNLDAGCERDGGIAMAEIMK